MTTFRSHPVSSIRYLASVVAVLCLLSSDLPALSKRSASKGVLYRSIILSILLILSGQFCSYAADWLPSFSGEGSLAFFFNQDTEVEAYPIPVMPGPGLVDQPPLVCCVEAARKLLMRPADDPTVQWVARLIEQETGIRAAGEHVAERDRELAELRARISQLENR